MIASLFRRQLGATLTSVPFFLAVSITVRRSLRALGAESEVSISKIFRLLTSVWSRTQTRATVPS